MQDYDPSEAAGMMLVSTGATWGYQTTLEDNVFRDPIQFSKRFDPQGTYIRHWLPQLRDTETRRLHEKRSSAIGSGALLKSRYRKVKPRFVVGHPAIVCDS